MSESTTENLEDPNREKAEQALNYYVGVEFGCRREDMGLGDTFMIVGKAHTDLTDTGRQSGTEAPAPDIAHRVSHSSVALGSVSVVEV